MFTQLKRLPWAQIPVGDRRRDTGHGRKETRTGKAVTVATDGGLGFPHVQQAVRITRTRTIAGKTSRETAYLVVSLPATHAQPADLQAWARHEWLIENQVHHVRDVTFGEDLHQARIGTGPAVIATLRNASIGFHRTNGDTNIARATRRANRRPHDLISAVTSSYPRTQPCMELRLLGAVEAFAHGQRVDLGPRKQRFFLSVLALEVNRLVPVERLVELAWPISPPRTATHAVRVCISRLRSILGTVPCGTALTLDSVGSGYMLPGDPMAIDVHRFRVLLARARASHDNEHKVTLLDEALQLWSGRPLSGSAPADSHERLCHGLTESRLAALEDWLAAHLALGRHRDVLDELVGLVQAYPMRWRCTGGFATGPPPTWALILALAARCDPA